MKTAADFKPTLSEAILILGPPGTGKTTLASQLPSPYFLECDNNLEGPIRYARDNKLSLDFKYDVPHINDDGTIVERALRYRRAAELFKKAALDPSIKTLVVDSFTTFVDYVLDEVRRQQGRKIADGKLTFVDEPMQIQDWGAFAGVMKHFIITARAFGKLLVCTGHLKTDKDDLAGYLKEYIAIPGQTAEIISGLFTEVWLLKIEERRGANAMEYIRIIRTVPSMRQDALGLKSSIGIGNVADVDFAKINALLKK